MTGQLQLTQQANPTAQTFVVDEACVLTGIGIYFASVSSVHPITLEMRPTTEAGTPSSRRHIPGTRVTAGPGTDNTFSITPTTDAGTFYSSPPVHRFTFEEPVYMPSNTLASFVLYTSAPAGEYQIYFAKTTEYKYGKTTAIYSNSTSTERGAFFASSNGTSWEADNTKDVTFKVYQAEFSTSNIATAVLNNNTPGFKRLTETSRIDGIGRYSFDPLLFTNGSNVVRVRHPGHGFQIGDKVTLKSDDTNSFDSSTSINGVLGGSILGTRTVDSADAFGYTFNMDSSADSSIRAGGTGLMASENHTINQMLLNMQYTTPPQTNISAKADLTTTKSLGGSETAYSTETNLKLPFNTMVRAINPYVVASADNETLRLSGNPSSKLTVSMWTDNPKVAPYINTSSAEFITQQHLIDYQDSDSYVGPDTRNKITTVDFVPETNANGGTTASKHITVPYLLENSSTSIVVLVDAIRPVGADFSVWYRVINSADETIKLEDQTWAQFSKTAKLTQGKTYSEIGADDYRTNEYEFSKFDLDAFDRYQIKITMNTSRSSFPPVFRNLRIIATS